VDFTFIVERRLAVGAGIWTREAMAELAGLGFTHVLNLQAEFDDSALAAEFGLVARWLPTEDDFASKPLAFFEAAACFALDAFGDPEARMYVHCAAGIHRAPLAGAAILHALGFDVEDAMRWIARCRVAAEFPPVYAGSLRAWAEARAAGTRGAPRRRRSARQILVDRNNPGSV
jgi:rhodanese-related sulfurtransferase